MSLRRWLPPSASDASRAADRAARVGDAVREGNWVGPHWLVRQLDLAVGDGAIAGDRSALVNVTRRTWTVVGNLDSDRAATVDPRGSVTPGLPGWSLDWWIGADDRWHVPARDAGVRQRLVDASPVVETAARIPGGDAIQRVYAIRRPSAEGGGEVVVVEVENSSKLPVALALAVRPYDPLGLAEVGRIDLDGTTVVVNGEPAVLLPRPPARVAASTLAGGDSAQVVLAGAAEQAWPGPVECPDGLAQAAFVFPLAHGASLRVALPLVAGDPVDRHGGRRRRGASSAEEVTPATPGAPTFPAVVPAAVHVAKGWEAQSRRGLRVDLPDARLAEALDANRRFLLLLHHRAASAGQTDGATGVRRPSLPPADIAQVVAALDHQGYHDEATDLLLSHAQHQDSDGRFPRGDGAANGAVLWALAHHWRLTRDRELAEALVDHVALAAHWIDRSRRRGGSPWRRRVGRTGSPAAGQARSLDVADDLWSVAGLWAAAELLIAVDQKSAANDAARAADTLWSGIEPELLPKVTAGVPAPNGAQHPRVGGDQASGEATTLEDAGPAPGGQAEASGQVTPPDQAAGTPAPGASGPGAGGDDEATILSGAVRAIDALAAWAPLALLPASDERAVRVVELARRLVDPGDGRAVVELAQRLVGPGDGRAVVDARLGSALSPSATLRLASAELLAGHGDTALDRLAWLLDVATPTWTWPPAVDIRHHGGTAGDGHDVAVAAAFLSFVRNLLVRESADGLALASAVPRSWFGQGWEVHDAPTEHGRMSYAVRWHGNRPALLWELEPHHAPLTEGAHDKDRSPVRLTAPGLDPTWSSTDPRGEALLAPVERATAAPDAPEGSFS